MKILVLFSIFLLISNPTFSCECIFPAPYDYGDHVRSYPLIFYAEVVSIEDQKNPNFESFPDLYLTPYILKREGIIPNSE